jgi:hypothetical protein
MDCCTIWVLAALAQADRPSSLALREEDVAFSRPRVPDWREFFTAPVQDFSEAVETADGDEGVPIDLRVEDVALDRLRELRNEPAVFPAFCRILFAGPAFLLEGITALTMPDRLIVGDQRIFDRGTGEDDLAWLFGRTLLRREISFLGGLGDSYLVTPGVETGAEPLDPHRFHRLQQKVVFDSLKRAYRERYQIPALELDTALGAISSGSWLDYVVIPGLFSAYTAKYGLDRKIRIGEDVRIDLSIEKGTRFYKVATQDHGGRLASVAINLFDLPLSAIVSVDSLEKGIGIGFVGLGTDLNAVIEAMNLARSEEPRDR